MTTDSLFTSASERAAIDFAAYHTAHHPGAVQVCESRGHYYVEEQGVEVRAWERMIGVWRGGQKLGVEG